MSGEWSRAARTKAPSTRGNRRVDGIRKKESSRYARETERARHRQRQRDRETGIERARERPRATTIRTTASTVSSHTCSSWSKRVQCRGCGGVVWWWWWGVVWVLRTPRRLSRTPGTGTGVMGASLRVPNDDERLARGMPLASWPTSERRSEGSSRLEDDEDDEEDEELSRAGSEERFLSLSLRMVSGGGGVAASFSTGEPLPRTTRGEELKGAQAGLRTPQRDGRPERAASIRATRRLALMDGWRLWVRPTRSSERYTSESETRLAEHTRRIYATNDESERAEKGKKRSIECVCAHKRDTTDTTAPPVVIWRW